MEDKMASMNGFDVKTYKRKLIAERIDTDPVARHGMAVSRAALLALVFLRLALFVFELVYFNAAELKVGIVSNLLLLPMLMIVYMIYDGNRGISSVLMISAIVRAIWLFATVYPTLPEESVANVYLGAYLAVMAYQFVATMLMTVYAPATAYFEKMQGINMELGAALRAALRAGASSRGVSQSPSRTTASNSRKKKKK